MKHVAYNMKHKTQKSIFQLANKIKRHFKMTRISCRRHDEEGVTLIELLAAISIFSAVALVATSVMIAMISSQRRAAGTVNVDNAMYFAMETAAKEIRTGSNFSCLSGTVSDCNEIQFTNYRGQTVTYRLNGSRMEKTCSFNCPAGFITPSNIAVTYLRFNMSGNNEFDANQARVTIVMTAETTGNAAKKEIKLQTTISSRSPDS